MCWNSQCIHVSVIEEHDQAVVCEMVDVFTGKSQYPVAVYALNTIEQRRELWQLIERVSQQLQGPMLVSGDFNAVLKAEDI